MPPGASLAAMPSSLAEAPGLAPRPQWPVVGLAVILVLGSCIAVADAGRRMVGLLFVGLILGFALFQASFGFAGAYRRLFLHGEVDAVRAQLVLLGLTTILFVPVLAMGSVFGHQVAGAAAP